MEGFDNLHQKILSVTDDLSKVKVGLEATGHYSYNLLGYLLDKGLPTFVINPLHTNLYRKSLTLRKTKTDTEFVNPLSQDSVVKGILWAANDIAYFDTKWGLLDSVDVKIKFSNFY